MCCSQIERLDASPRPPSVELKGQPRGGGPVVNGSARVGGADAPLVPDAARRAAVPTEVPPDDVVISVRDLGKSYHIYDRPQDRLKQALLRWKRQYFREFWALRHVAFEVKRGQALGVIGRNGSGKSTLLQIIAGTLVPTEGEVTVRGRLSALLELSSGFNTEFTGRENVFLQGAIMGIPRKVMEEKFDQIAGFADIGAFIDQPVKTYSSGMQARLAFSVSIAIDPEILIVDEILAVGDIGFQQRCLARLRRLRENGLTLLFVSHSPDSVKSICDTGLVLVQGQPIFYGPAEPAMNQYLRHIREQANQDALIAEAALRDTVKFRTNVPGQMRYGSGHVQIESVRVMNGAGEPTKAFEFRDRVVVEATLVAQIDIKDVSVSFLIRDQTGVDLMGTTTFDEAAKLPPMKSGQPLRVRFEFENILRPGSFGVCLAVTRVSARDYSDNVLLDQVDGCAAFLVIGRPDRPIHYKFHQPISISWEPNEASGH